MLTGVAPLLRSLPRDSRDTLFLLLVIAWLLLPQTAHLPAWCIGLAATVLAARGWLALGSKSLPGRGWLIGLLVLAVAGTFFSHQTVLGRDAGVTLLVVLLTLKTLELRARRDAFVIFFLGFFCMLSNFFYSQSLLIAVNMVVGLLGLLTVLVNAHMPVGKPPLLEAARTAGWMALFGAPVMLVLFLFFPRLAPLWGVPGDAMTGRSGLGANMQIGNIASLALDDSVAMRIKFEGPAPAQRDLYFRGPVLSDFDGREWRPLRLDPARSALTSSLAVSGIPVNYEVTLEPTNRPWIFVMEAALEAPVVPGYQSTMQYDLQWLLNRPVSDLVRYKAQSFSNFRHGPAQPVPGLRQFVELPPGFNPRTLALAREIRGDPLYASAGSAALVQVVMDRLRSGGYSYTLEPGVYGRDTADEFWFDRKQGFCEHIASAFVVLMRALDVPARIVTGYQGGEPNSVDGFWTVRQSDAHAWAEVWQEGLGWVRVDPTSAVAPGRTGAFQRLAAPRGLVAETLGNLSPGFTAQLRATWDAINNRWNQSVLNYTQGKQLNLLKDMGFSSPSWIDLSYVLLGIVVFASAGAAAWTLWDRVQHDPWLRLLARARRQLARAGIESSPSTSPRQLAQMLDARYAGGSGEKARAWHDWLMQLELHRYATAPNMAARDSQQLRQLRRRLNALRWPA
jgi:transglutaminase-like putative cysteine protease